MHFRFSSYKKKFKIKVYNFFTFIINKSVFFSNIIFYINLVFLNNYFSLFKIKYISNQKSYREFNVSTISYNYNYLSFDTNKNIKKTKKLNGLGYSLLENCSIIASSEFIFKNNFCYGQKHKLPFSLNYIKFNNFKGSLSSNSKYILCSRNRIANKKIDKAVYISGSYDLNWYHWLIEVLPKLYIFKKIINHYKDYQIVVPERIVKSINHKKTLSLFTDLNNIITIKQGVFYNVESLLYIESPSYSDFEMKKKLKVKIQNGNLYYDVLHSYTKFIKSKIICNKNFQNKYIYLYRKTNKRKFNQNEVLEVLRKFHFEIIDAYKLSFIDQVNIFNSAKIIVGPPGAAWANIIFAKRGSYGLIFRPNIIGDSSTFPNLSKLVGLSLYSQDMKTEESDWQKIMRSNREAHIDIDLLKKNILNIFSLIHNKQHETKP